MSISNKPRTIGLAPSNSIIFNPIDFTSSLGSSNVVQIDVKNNTVSSNPGGDKFIFLHLTLLL